MNAAREEVAAAADEVAEEQRQVARDPRAMQRERNRGWSWARSLDHADGPIVFERLRSSARQLTHAGGQRRQ